jgi:hypothetical protein
MTQMCTCYSGVEFESTLHCREVGSMQTMMERTVL